jgi:hypothetical protein
MDIASWLRQMGLEQYEPVFRAHAIDGLVLPSLTAEDLKDLGVELVGHRRKLLDAIAALHTAPTPVSGRQATMPAGAERRHLTVLFCDLPTVSDRALQRSTAEVLSAIYEQDFLPCSFGGRPKLSAHHALATLNEVIAGGMISRVLEADLKNFFGSPSRP